MQTANPSLRETIRRITLQATIATVMMAGLGVAAYWILNRELSRAETLTELTQNAPRQIRELLPSFLLVEQKAGLELSLAKIKASESLNSINLIEGGAEPIKASCIARDGFYECPSDIANTIAIAIPIDVGDHHFGYLLKNVNVNTPISSASLFWTSIVVLTLLIAFAFMLIRLFNRVTAKDVPNSLERLVVWAENWLRGKDDTQGQCLQFSEFDQLAAKIAQVFDKHEEERNQAVVGQLSSGILHDIKNDLQSVLAAHCLVEEQDVASEKRLRRLENLNRVLTAKLPNLINIVETTLDVNRDIRIKARFDDVEKTLQGSIKDLSQQIAQNGAKITVDSPSGQLSAYHDPVQLRRVFSNLISNSLDALAKTDSKEKLIQITLEQSDSNVKIRLEDGGPGLEINQADLFKAFKTTKATGTGLGLFNAQRIIQSHGGRIRCVRPKVLSGASFEVTFPSGGYHAAT